MADETLKELAAEAFIYGFPLVFNLDEIERVTKEGLGALPPAPVNGFGHATKLAGPEERFVSINNDTVYSVAIIDLSAGPVRLDVPGTSGRYYVLQFVDAWTNNFAYVGHRATGTEAGSFLLVPPDWDGSEPADLTVIRAPTRLAAIVGRWAVEGEADLPAVCELQAKLRLTAAGGPPGGIPQLDPGVPTDLAFFEKLRAWARAFPPAQRDREFQERFRPLGLLDAESPFADPSQQLADALRSGMQQGREALEDSLRHGPNPKQNGWDLTYHIFDYNLDHFEVGALDDPRWRIADADGRYLLRAGAARGGLWGNHGYEAAYAMVYEDADGEPLDGSLSYALRFPTEPPCGAFWSVTMYDTPDFFLVDNPVDRYSIGDRTEGLIRGDDGSLTIYMQREEPSDPIAKANWLPTPEGRFRPLLRIYEPEDPIFDGGYELPPITRLG